MLKTSCIYASIFETAQNHVTVDGYRLSDYPRPFIIEPPFIKSNHYKTGDAIECNLILMGKAIDYLPFFIYAFSELGKRGIGSSRGRYKIKEITDIPDNEREIFNGNTDQIINSPTRFSLRDLTTGDITGAELSITFKTPVRIKRENRFTKSLDFHLLIQNLLRRISLLSMVCEDTSWSIDYRMMIKEASEEVRLKDSGLYWYDWQSYSGRQKSKMNLGGLLGTIVYEGGIKNFLPLLKAGECLHIGKACTFGLGKYTLSYP